MNAKTKRSWNLNSANLEDSVQYFQELFGAEVVGDGVVLTYTIPMPSNDVTTDSAPVPDFVQSGPYKRMLRKVSELPTGTFRV